jgi:hypothetical protein
MGGHRARATTGFRPRGRSHALPPEIAPGNRLSSRGGGCATAGLGRSKRSDGSAAANTTQLPSRPDRHEIITAGPDPPARPTAAEVRSDAGANEATVARHHIDSGDARNPHEISQTRRSSLVSGKQIVLPAGSPDPCQIKLKISPGPR